jgi:cardiolipin synthase
MGGFIEAPTDLITGNAVRLLRNGEEVFPRWLEAIDAARSRISLEMYIFNDDLIGRRMGDALGRAAERGVQVRLLYDFIGCRDASPGFFEHLRVRGVRVRPYHPYRIWRPRFWSLLRRNHRKTLVVDGALAFTGGLNIADEWLPAEQGGGGWHDAVVEVRGPAARRLEQIFFETWNRKVRREHRVASDALPMPSPAGETSVVVISNTESGDRFAIRRAALHAIREGRRRVLLANPYFVPDPGISRGLCGAAARGVDVRVLVPAESDSLTLDHAARATFPRLLRAGVRIFLQPTVVHTKVILVDDLFVSLGSYNLDHRSLSYNLESVVNAEDAALGAAAAEMLDKDIAAADELPLASLEGRSAVTWLQERLAYAIRRWL